MDLESNKIIQNYNLKFIKNFNKRLKIGDKIEFINYILDNNLDNQYYIIDDLKFDKDGNYANIGKVDDLILDQAIDNFEFKSYETSLDVKDFDTSFVKGLSFEDGCATLTKFSAYLIADGLIKINKQIFLNIMIYFNIIIISFIFIYINKAYFR